MGCRGWAILGRVIVGLLYCNWEVFTTLVNNQSERSETGN